MRYLILSDIHSNWEALQSVLHNAAGEYDRIVCCGDLAGYGPDPNLVLDWSRANLFAVIRGNHDRACSGLDDLEWFNPVAKQASYWTMDHISPENADYLRQLPAGPLPVDDFMLAHGTPLDEDEYLTSEQGARNLFPYLESNLVFFGHTHLQGAFVWRKGRVEVYQRPCSISGEMELRINPESACLINPGSVGQPRDFDSRAAFLIYDQQHHTALFRRVPYDGEETRRKIIAAGLPDSLGNRLLAGR